MGLGYLSLEVRCYFTTEVKPTLKLSCHVFCQALLYLWGPPGVPYYGINICLLNAGGVLYKACIFIKTLGSMCLPGYRITCRFN